MEQVTAQLGEVVQLAQLERSHVVYLAITQPRTAMRLMSAVGLELDAHATATGKALLATLPTDEVARRLGDGPLTRHTDATITDVDALLHVLEQVRRDGYAIDDEEYISGCRCVAVPLTSMSEMGIHTAVSITAPTSRTAIDWPREELKTLRPMIAVMRQRLGLGRGKQAGEGARPSSPAPSGPPSSASAPGVGRHRVGRAAD